jgi:L-seryl-tRNA(Ser) seleniumtransferase
MCEPPSSERAHGRRQIPAVHRVLAAYHEAGGTFSDSFIVPAIRSTLDAIRHDDGRPEQSVPELIDQVVKHLLRLERPRLSSVLNGTGVILHTNLGRAPVSAATAAAMAAAASSNVPLELDPETGERGKRMDEIARLLHWLTGAESALVVNNNAAAILLVLSAVAAGREVVLSRGEAVEIGGGVRIPDVLAQSGARMVEVGTTNRTYAVDYERAIGPQTAAILKVHPSNFRMDGFVRQATIAELALVAQSHGLPLIEDQGSGLLLDPAEFGLSGDRPVSESLEAGADIVTMSGDKLIGGPQAGVILGRGELVERCSRHPLARAVRADKTTLAGVAVTLRHYARGEALGEIPVWRMISAPVSELRCRAEAIQARCPTWEVVDSDATIGGGSLPGSIVPSISLARSNPGGTSVKRLAATLRTGEPAVYSRIENDRLLIDLRTIPASDDGRLIDALSRIRN